MPDPAPSVQPRPRKRQAATAPKPANGHAVVDERTLALTHALEDLHSAAKALNLAPMRVEWLEEPSTAVDIDPERMARQAHVSSFLADYEGLRAGPIAPPIASLAAPPDPHAFLVGNLIRPGTTVMLAGPPGAAKSWAARQLALAAGSGEGMFLDRYELTRPLNVLVIDEDNGPDEEWRRDESLIAHLGLQRQQLLNVWRVSLAGVRLDEERWQRWLRGQIRLHDIDLTILDPISEMHGGKELREDPAFRSMLAFLKRLKIDFPQHSTLVVHHTRKRDQRATGPSTLEDVRGQWGQTPDVVAMLASLGDRRSKWEVHKRVPHSSLILEQVAQGEPGEGGLKYVADAGVQKDKAMENDNAVIDAIRGGLTTHGDIQDTLAMAPSTLTGVLKRLVKHGLIRQDGRGRGAVYEEVEDDDSTPN